MKRLILIVAGMNLVAWGCAQDEKRTDVKPDGSRDAGGTDATGGTQDGGLDTGNLTCRADGTCAGLRALYQNLLTTHGGCIPGMAGTCAKKFAADVGCRNGPCVRWVTATTDLESVRARWNSEGCGQCEVTCPASTCVTPAIDATRATTGTCQPRTLAAEPAKAAHTSPPAPLPPGICNPATP